MIEEITKSYLNSRLREVKTAEFDEDSYRVFFVFADHSLKYINIEKSKELFELLKENKVTAVSCSNNVSLRLLDPKTEDEEESQLVSLWQTNDLVFRFDFSNNKALVVYAA